jgi:hypothetical protein
MTTYTLLEDKLLSAANIGDLPTIAELVSRMSIKEKESVSTDTYDTVLYKIAHHAQHLDPAEANYTMMIFVRNVGRYISPGVVSTIIKSSINKPQETPAYRQRRNTDVRVQQMRVQSALLQRRTSDIRGQEIQAQSATSY